MPHRTATQAAPAARDKDLLSPTVRAKENERIAARREVMFPDREAAGSAEAGSNAGGSTEAGSNAGAHPTNGQASNGAASNGAAPTENGSARSGRSESGSTRSRGSDAASNNIGDLVGLCLSGGGARSASFNLGVLQSFVERGLIRWVDYLSTVSGGGYIGATFSSLLNHPEVKQLDRDLDLVREPGGGQSPRIQRFLRGGQYLKDSLQVSDRFLIGFLLSAIVWGSLLVAVTCSLAMLCRLLDAPPLIEWVRAHGWESEHWWQDYTRPFLPAVALFGLWLAGWPFSYLNRKRHNRYEGAQRWRARMLWGALFCLGIGVAVFLGNAEVYAPAGKSVRGSAASLSTKQAVHTWTTNIVYLMLGVSILALLPYLNPANILRSEVRRPSKARAAVLSVAGAVLLLLAPLCLIWFFGREDVLGYQARRGPNLTVHDVRSSFGWLDALERERNTTLAGGPPTLGAVLYAKVLRRFEAPDEALDSPSLGKLLAENASQRGMAAKLATLSRDSANVALRDVRTLDQLRKIRAAIDDPRYNADLTPADRYYLGKVVSLAAAERLAAAFNPPPPREVEATADSSPSAGDDAFSWLRMVAITRPAAVAVQNTTTSYPPAPLDDPQVWKELQKMLADEATADAFLARAEQLRESGLLLDSLMPRAKLTGGQLSAEDRRRLNRLILEAAYPTQLRERADTSLHAVWSDDQRHRLYIVLGALGCFLLFGSLVDINATSLHGFYTDRLRDAYIVPDGNGEKLQNLDTTSKGGPYHLFCAALNFYDTVPWKMPEYDRTYTYLFSPDYCGSEALTLTPAESTQSVTEEGYAPTEKYCGGDIDLANVVAISGAAFSPTIFTTPFMTIVCWLLNLRFGQWLPNPRRYANGQSPKLSAAVGVFPLLRDAFRTATQQLRSRDWGFCFVSDGGHNDNLGLTPLAIRRCSLIIISDASMDPQHDFDDLIKYQRRTRIRGGWEFLDLEPGSPEEPEGSIDLAPLKLRKARPVERWRGRSESSSRFATWWRRWREMHVEHEVLHEFCDGHFVFARLRYGRNVEPGFERTATNLPSEALVIYVKPSFTGDEPIDLKQYRDDFPQFPHDPTTDQFFTENQIESYRQLGSHIADELISVLALGEQQYWQQRGEPHRCDGAGDFWEKDYDVDALIEMFRLGYTAFVAQHRRIGPAAACRDAETAPSGNEAADAAEAEPTGMQDGQTVETDCQLARRALDLLTNRDTASVSDESVSEACIQLVKAIAALQENEELLHDVIHLAREDKRPMVRRTVIEILSIYGPAVALKVAHATEDAQPSVQIELLQVLKTMAMRQPLAPEYEDVIDDVLAILDDKRKPNRDVRLAVIGVLTEIYHPARVENARTALARISRSSSTLRSAAQRALKHWQA